MNVDLIVVPKGSFWMGANASDEDSLLENGPLREIWLSAFAIQRSPVTVQQWLSFLQETRYPWESMVAFRETDLGSDWPIVFVSWFDATAFADWMTQSTGLRFTLPSDAQWERACRGTEGQLCPWGNQELDWLDEMALNPERSKKVEARINLPSAIGCLDMWFNVREWCSDWYSDELGEMAPEELEYLDPKGPALGSYRVVRGGNALFKG